jgi:cobalt-zinc-cadmium efflux system outer membrane protein
MFARQKAAARAVLVVALTAPTIGAARAETITLDEALRLAEKNNPDIRTGEADVQVAEGELEQARTIAFNPELAVEAGPVIGGGEEGLEYQVSLSQVFQLGGKRRKRTAGAEARKSAASLRFAWARQLVALRVRRVFWGAVAAREILATAREGEAIADELHAAADERLKQGAGTQLEVNLASAARGRARAERLAAERRYREARAELAAAVGAPAESNLEPSGDLAGFSAPDARFEELLASAIRRPDVAAAAKDLAAAEVDLALAKALAFPDLSVGVVYGHEVDKDVVLAGVSIALPLWNRNQGGRRAARATMRRAQVVDETSRREAERAVRTAYVAYQLAREAVAAFDRDVVEKLGENLQFARESMRAGKIGILEFSIVRGDLVDTRVAYLNAIRDLVEARYALELAAGASLGREP